VFDALFGKSHQRSDLLKRDLTARVKPNVRCPIENRLLAEYDCRTSNTVETRCDAYSEGVLC
jgi:hypothetical protein